MTGALPRPTVAMRTSQTRPVVMVGVLVLSDAIALIVSVVLGVLLKVLLVGHTGLDGYLRLWPFVFVFIAFYSAVGLYSGAALSPPEELRRATFSSAFLFPTIAALTASWRGPSRYVTPALFCRSFCQRRSGAAFSRVCPPIPGKQAVVGLSDGHFRFW